MGRVNVHTEIVGAARDGMFERLKGRMGIIMSIVRSLKACIKQLLVNRQHKRYEEMLKKTKKNYNDWIKYKESRLQSKHDENLSLALLSFAECGLELYEKVYSMQEEVIVFYHNDGEISKLAKPLLMEFMTAHPSVSLVYGDEDQKGTDGRRVDPWFKPDWSPDLFWSKFYFGNIFAARHRNVLAVLQDMQKSEKISLSPEKNLYELCKKLAEESGGFAKRPAGDIDWFPVGHIPEILFHGRKAPVLWEGSFQEEYKDCSGQLIAVVIPSKDHPDVLKRCIQSFVKYTTYHNYQFIVVDNGSTDENKRETAAFLEMLNQNKNNRYFNHYLYDRRPFNFSEMCNKGVKAAHPEANLLLFLNDDMEIVQADWLDKMAGKAILPHVGAVGAKLLYPGSDIIQHAGITNLRIGPAHKLQFLSDKEVHYFGKNRGVHNVAAVTGACLMVRKSVFEEAGGFPEELAVAFNDVDLCYSIWKAGYYNVVLNDVTLFHHESLSRGKDGETEEKRIRLLKEKDMLYHRHQTIYGKDPFYHKYLISDMLIPEYLPAFHYEVDLEGSWAQVTADRGEVAGCPADECLRVGVECATDLCKWKYGIAWEEIQDVSPEDRGYYLQGYSFVIGGDNACYERTLLMKDSDQKIIWKVPIETEYRPDIKEELKDQLNVDLTGFSAKIRGDAVPPGNYLFGMMVKDRCSRQRIVNWSERQFIIEG